MKKIINPATKEEAVYYSDFSGKCFDRFHSPISLTLDFGYGSRYDGSKLSFDLDDEDVESILDVLKSKLSTDAKMHLKKRHKALSDDYCSSVEFRDWDNCNLIGNTQDLIEKII